MSHRRIRSVVIRIVMLRLRLGESNRNTIFLPGICLIVLKGVCLALAEVCALLNARLVLILNFRRRTKVTPKIGRH